ncbi:hypothetical protein U0070_008323 [Myodes glareolus]|uniref:Ubiquitin carboxyl-terminal hydrolase MINDY n=1 Tax=Myodes glareolus TaxID=447135 RepID=A0AAW0IXR0_MYOGA
MFLDPVPSVTVTTRSSAPAMEQMSWAESVGRDFRWKNQLVSDKADDKPDALWLEDVEDELIKEDIVLSPLPSMLKLQTVSKPIDLSLAKAIRFGDDMVPISCEKYDRLPEFEEHQAVPGLFSPSLSLIARLAAPTALPVQERHVSMGQVNPCLRLQPSDAQRTHCLALAIADILWRAGGREQAVVALILMDGERHWSVESGRGIGDVEQQPWAQPQGKAKEEAGKASCLTLYSLTCSEDLVTFLQQSIHQFEVGPYGCILLTLSAILSRSLEL